MSVLRRRSSIIFIVVEYFRCSIFSASSANAFFCARGDLIINNLLCISCCRLVQHIQHFQLFVAADIALRVLAVCIFVRDLGYDRFILYPVNADRYLLRKLRLVLIVHKQRLYFKIIGYYILFRRFQRVSVYFRYAVSIDI